MTAKKTAKEGDKISEAVILFVRRPELGKVKSRIAATEGDEKALNIYKILLQHTHYVLSQINADILVFYYDQIVDPDLWSDISNRKFVQSEGDLGKRMQSAFAKAFESYNRVLIIGSDCAQLRVNHIEDAFSKLEHSDLIIGPSLDGGYYLLGCSGLYPQLFEDISWSSDKVFTQTLAASKKIGLSKKKLEKLSDIDHIEDWEKYGWPYVQV